MTAKNSRAERPSNLAFLFALRSAARLLLSEPAGDALEQSAEEIVELALASPESMGDFGQWEQELRRVLANERPDQDEEGREAAAHRFLAALCEAMRAREQQWQDAALERASESDSAGVFGVFQALFLPVAVRLALHSPFGSMPSWAAAERSRLAIIGGTMDLLPEASRASVRHLAVSGSMSVSMASDAFTKARSGTPPEALSLFLSPAEASAAARSVCQSPNSLSQAEFNDFAPLFLKEEPSFLSSGQALRVAGPYGLPRFPEPFVSVSLARQLLSQWRPGPGALSWAKVTNSANLAKWACMVEGAIEQVVERIPKEASWPQALTGYFSLPLPAGGGLYFNLEEGEGPRVSASDCALLCGRHKALAVFTKRFGPPSLERLWELERFASGLSEERAQALRARLAELEADELSLVAPAQSAPRSARGPRI